MSYGIPAIDISGYSVGQSFQIKLDTVRGKTAFDPGNITPGYIRMYNESGSGLNIQTDMGDQEYLPAGGWYTHPITQNVHVLTATVIYKMQNPTVQTLLAIYYQPGEFIPPIPILGNSPTSGVSQTSSIQTLSNEGQAANTLVIDMGDLAFSQIVALYNDGHALWGVDQTGVKHQVIKINTTGNALQLGQAGDTVEQLGNETVDGNLVTVGGYAGGGATPNTNIAAIIGTPAIGKNALVLFRTTSGQTADVFEIQDETFVSKVYVNSALALHTVNTLFADGGLTENGTLAVTGAINQNGGQATFSQTGTAVSIPNGNLSVLNSILAGTLNVTTIRDNTTGASQITLATAGISFTNTIQSAITLLNNVAYQGLDTDGTTARLLIRMDSLGNTSIQAGSSGHIQLKDGSNTLWTDVTSGAVAQKVKGNGFQFYNTGFLPELSFFTGTGTGTYNHGFNGAGESISPFWIAPIVQVSGSATQGYDTVTTTQAHVTLGASLSFKAGCL